MFLHRYFGSHAFETLKDAELLASRISSFNDPFEFLYVCDFGKMTPELAREFIRSCRNNPDLLLFLIELNQQLPIPLAEQEIQRRHDEGEPLIVASLVNDWPAIANKTELTLEERKQIRKGSVPQIVTYWPIAGTSLRLAQPCAVGWQ